MASFAGLSLHLLALLLVTNSFSELPFFWLCLFLFTILFRCYFLGCSEWSRWMVIFWLRWNKIDLLIWLFRQLINFSFFKIKFFFAHLLFSSFLCRYLFSYPTSKIIILSFLWDLNFFFSWDVSFFHFWSFSLKWVFHIDCQFFLLFT